MLPIKRYNLRDSVLLKGTIMKDNFSLKILVVCLSTIGLFHVYACKKENAPPSSGPTAPAIYSEIDTQAIAAKAGAKFNVIKADSQGTDIRHKFLWVCFANGTTHDKVEEVVKNILDALITKYSSTCHCYTFHLFHENKLTITPEDSQPFARASFLPEGSRLKVGRIPIGGFAAYRLIIEYTGRPVKI